MSPSKQPLRVGIGGPVGSGKTALMEQLCKRLRGEFEIAAITNDIYTKEDARILVEAGALDPDRIMGVETGGCPHTAIREDASINLAAIDQMRKRFRDLDLILIEFGRRQSRRDVLARTRRHHDLRHRRLGRRENPAQGRPRRHALRPARDQQDRPRPLRRRLARSDGGRRRPHAQDAAVHVCEHEDGAGGRRGDRVHSRQGRTGGVKDLLVERSVWHGYCESSATPARWVGARGAHNVRRTERRPIPTIPRPSGRA